MGKRLIIAEKPSVGRDIANVFNCRENGEGCRIGEHDIVTWAVGHLVGLRYPEEMDDKYKEWKLEDLPIIPDPFQLKVLESGEKQFKIVSSLMNDPSIDRIVCATDAGREGELIFRYIYQMAGCSKPVDRLWISSLTYVAIKEGFENLKPDSEYDHLYESAKCRSEADWLVGMNGSRAYAIVNDMRRLSVGRVLSPTLSILVDREMERRYFIPEEYCEVIASYGGFEGRMLNEDNRDTDAWSHFPIEQKNDLQRFLDNHSNLGNVISYECEEELQPPQLLYDLTSLQRDANRLLGMSSKRTLDIAQALYERHKAITYPRTDSRYLSSDIKSTLPKRLESLQAGAYSEYVVKALSSDRDLFGRFISNKGVSDHHAIIPTGEAKGMDSWTKQEQQIFDLICKRFIGMFLPDRHVMHQEIRISISDKTFISHGEEELDPGWSAVDDSRKRRIQSLPEMDDVEAFLVRSLRMRTDTTKPPAPHTEASLLTAMEHAGRLGSEEDSEEKEYGIGTPATRAATIEKMLEKEMAVRNGRALLPTEYGIKLISILPEILRSPEMTGEWEERLSHISRGEESSASFMEGIKNLTNDVIDYAIKNGDTGIKDSKYVGRCPLCGDYVKEYENAYYCRNIDCEFRAIYKVGKGLYPTLKSVTMQELLISGEATSDKGTYRLIDDKPYIEFKYAPKPEPDYKSLWQIIEDYGLEFVDKVPTGGGLWIAGEKHDELMMDFVRECKEIRVTFTYYQESKALKHGSGWCHRVDSGHKVAYMTSIGRIYDNGLEESNDEQGNPIEESSITELIESSGFEYVDKRANGGSLWIIAGESEGRTLIMKLNNLGMSFQFTANGGKASKHRPAWYSVK